MKQGTKKLIALIVALMVLAVCFALAACGTTNQPVEPNPIVDPGNDNEDIDVTSVTVDQTSVTLKAGQTVQLEATVLPENATDKAVSWSTDNAEVATVSDGLVTAIAEGTANITAMADGVEGKCVVTVEGQEILLTFVNVENANDVLNFLPNGTLPVGSGQYAYTTNWTIDDNGNIAIEAYMGIVTFKVYKAGSLMKLDMTNSIMGGTTTYAVSVKDYFTAFDLTPEVTGTFSGATDGNSIKIYNTGEYEMKLGSQTITGMVEFTRGQSLKLAVENGDGYQFAKDAYSDKYTYKLSEDSESAEFTVSGTLMAHYLGETAAYFSDTDDSGNKNDLYFFADGTVVIGFPYMGTAMEMTATYVFDLNGNDPVLTITAIMGTANCAYDADEDVYNFSYTYSNSWMPNLPSYTMNMQLEGTDVYDALEPYKAAKSYEDYEVTIVEAKNGDASVDLSKVKVTVSGAKIVIYFNDELVETVNFMTTNEGNLIYMNMQSKVTNSQVDRDPTSAGFTSFSVGRAERVNECLIFGIDGITYVKFEVSDAVWAKLAADAQ